MEKDLAGDVVFPFVAVELEALFDKEDLAVVLFELAMFEDPAGERLEMLEAQAQAVGNLEGELAVAVSKGRSSKLRAAKSFASSTTSARD